MNDLLQLAQRMMLRAHAPYSKFHVGAALRAEDGSIHGGCNVENAAYPQGTCAEAGAIAAMVAAGGKRILECLVVGRARRSSRPAAAAARSCASSRPTTCRSISAARRAASHRDPGPALADVVRSAPSGEAMTEAITRRRRLQAQGRGDPGSGLGGFAEEVKPVATIPYGELPGFPQTTVGSHAGKLVLGHVGPTPVAVLQGRAHYYERGKADEMRGAIAPSPSSGARPCCRPTPPAASGSTCRRAR
jgi:homotetrameric cytidine deaminase